MAKRPWQHVLEPLSGYLVLAQALYEQGTVYSGAWNFGPNDRDTRSVQEVIEILIEQWNGAACWQQDRRPELHEAHFLKLDCSKVRYELGCSARWTLEKAIEAIVQWQAVFRSKGDISSTMRYQIDEYCYSQ